MANFELVKPVEVIGGPTANVDALYGPYDSTSLANAGVLSGLRAKGRTVGIFEDGAVVEYWWESGTADDDLVAKGGGGGGGTWGSITGTLSDQTDLQSALDGKQASLGFTAENVANKSISVVTDQASDTKYPSVKAVYDWAVGAFQTALGFTPENVANKSTDVATDQASDTKYPSVKAVYDWVVGQLATKQDTITGAATTIDTEDLTASRALVSDPSGKVAVSDVTATELGYLDGVTSAVQTQLNDKIAKSTGTTYNVYTLSALTQDEYEAIVTPDADTIYFII